MTPEERNNILTELNAIRNALQLLNAPLTEDNVVIMNGCFNSIKYVYNLIENSTKGETENGNADAE